MTLVFTVTDGEPDLETILEALRKPARPLFLGRKTCLPSRPLLDPTTPVVEGNDLLAILEQVPTWDRGGAEVAGGPREACWPANLSSGGRGKVRRVFDLRDWASGLPAGSSLRAEGLIGEASL